MASDRVTVTRKSNGDWVVRYGNRSYNYGPGASGEAHAKRKVQEIYASKQRAKQGDPISPAGPRRRR